AGALGRRAVIDWIAATARTAALTASVCTGAFLLARAGLLDGRRVTTHWEDIDDLRRMFPALKVEEGPRWIDEGPIVTSAGISAGIATRPRPGARPAAGGPAGPPRPPEETPRA